MIAKEFAASNNLSQKDARKLMWYKLDSIEEILNDNHSISIGWHHMMCVWFELRLIEISFRTRLF